MRQAFDNRSAFCVITFSSTLILNPPSGDAANIHLPNPSAATNED